MLSHIFYNLQPESLSHFKCTITSAEWSIDQIDHTVHRVSDWQFAGFYVFLV